MKNYPDLAMRTNAPNAGNYDNVNPWLVHASLGLCDEAGELFAAKPGSINEKEELGDLLWFCALAGQVIKFESGIDVWSSTKQCTPDKTLALAAACELAGLIKKPYAYGKEKPMPYARVAGQIMMIIAVVKAVCVARGWDIFHVKAANIAKLQERYPEKFDSTAAYNRDLKKEAAAVESAK